MRQSTLEAITTRHARNATHVIFRNAESAGLLAQISRWPPMATRRCAGLGRGGGGGIATYRESVLTCQDEIRDGGEGAQKGAAWSGEVHVGVGAVEGWEGADGDLVLREDVVGVVLGFEG